MEEDLDYPILFSQRGVVNLAHSLQDVRDSVRRVNANKLNGIDAEWLDPQQVKEVCPIVNIDPDVRYPVHGATYQPRAGIAKHDYVAWGYARRANDMGVDIIQNCEVTGSTSSTAGSRRSAPTAAPSRPGKVALAAAGHTSVLAEMVGLRLPIQSHPLQALVSELLEPVHPTVVMSNAVHVYVSQAHKGELVMGAGHRQLQRLRPARRVPHHRAADGRGARALPDLRQGAPAAQLGRHRRHHPRRVAHRRVSRPSRASTSTAAGAPAGSRPPRASAGASRTPSRTTARTPSTPPSPWSGSSPAPSSTSTAPPPWRTERPRSFHAAHQLPLVRAPRGGRVPLRRTGARRLPDRHGGAVRRRVGRVPLLPGQPQGPLRRALVALGRLPPVVQRHPRHRDPPVARRLPPRRAEAGDLMSSTFRLPEGGRVDRDARLPSPSTAETYQGLRGDTLASALLANGVHQVATSIKLGRPRGIMAAGAEDPNALVQVETPFPEPMLTATTVELSDGLVARGLPGQGRLADRPDPARYDAVHAHCDVLVVGAGPAGLAAALTAARSGARVVLVDEQPEAGGSLLGSRDEIDGAPSLDWVAAAVAELSDPPRRHRPPADHGLRLLRRRLRPRPARSAPTTSDRTPRHASPGSGSGGSGAARRARHRRPRAPARLRRQRPAGHHARRVGPHLPAPLRRGRGARGGGLHDRRQRVRRGRRPRRRGRHGSLPSSTRGLRRRPTGRRSAPSGASRSAPGRSSPAPAAPTG